MLLLLDQKRIYMPFCDACIKNKCCSSNYGLFSGYVGNNLSNFEIYFSICGHLILWITLTILAPFTQWISAFNIFSFAILFMGMPRIGREDFLLSRFPMFLELWILTINLYNNGINILQFVAGWQFLWIRYFSSCSLCRRYGLPPLLWFKILHAVSCWLLIFVFTNISSDHFMTNNYINDMVILLT